MGRDAGLLLPSSTRAVLEGLPRQAGAVARRESVRTRWQGVAARSRDVSAGGLAGVVGSPDRGLHFRSWRATFPDQAYPLMGWCRLLAGEVTRRRARKARSPEVLRPRRTGSGRCWNVKGRWGMGLPFRSGHEIL